MGGCGRIKGGAAGACRGEGSIEKEGDVGPEGEDAGGVRGFSFLLVRVKEIFSCGTGTASDAEEHMEIISAAV